MMLSEVCGETESAVLELAQLVKREVTLLNRVTTLLRRQRAAAVVGDFAALDVVRLDVELALRDADGLRRRRGHLLAGDVAVSPGAAEAVVELKRAGQALLQEATLNEQLLREAVRTGEEMLRELGFAGHIRCLETGANPYAVECFPSRLNRRV